MEFSILAKALDGGDARAVGARRPQLRESFWALRDINLKISRGESLGFLGPNGAGKSTLLKLASRILSPTAGQVQVRGRVAGLLELGTGFHPDLTGRENISLYGSLMGMSRSEIRGKLDAIVAFAELENFPFIECFVNTACPRIAYDEADKIGKAVVNVDEI